MGLRAEIRRMHRRALLKAQGDQYAKIFNLRTSVLGGQHKINWSGQHYVIEDPDLASVRQNFRHERQGNMAYEYGLAARAAQLGSAYRLEQIPFDIGDTVIDCGANVGDLRLWFRLNGVNIRYRAFEPSPVEFECLALNCPDDECHNVGLWNSEGTMQFYVSSQGADSSLIEPVSYDEIITVSTQKLSAYVDGPVKLLKLEAEGAEPEILEGAEECLADIAYISADLGFERGVDCESTLAPVSNFLLSRGFEMLAVGHQRVYALFRNKKFSCR